jgi:hypothetical protein
MDFDMAQKIIYYKGNAYDAETFKKVVVKGSPRKRGRPSNKEKEYMDMDRLVKEMSKWGEIYKDQKIVDKKTMI